MRRERGKKNKKINHFDWSNLFWKHVTRFLNHFNDNASLKKCQENAKLVIPPPPPKEISNDRSKNDQNTHNRKQKHLQGIKLAKWSGRRTELWQKTFIIMSEIHPELLNKDDETATKLSQRSPRWIQTSWNRKWWKWHRHNDHRKKQRGARKRWKNEMKNRPEKGTFTVFFVLKWR